MPISKKHKREILLKEFARGIPKTNSIGDKKGCLIYTRVSSKAQHDSNHSLETQLSAILKYVERNGLNIIKQFGHTYESGKSDLDRREFQKMIAFAKKHKREIGQILVYSFDRWSRTGIGGAYLAAELKKLDIQLVSVSQPTDLDNPSGDLMKNMLLIFAEHDNLLRKEKCVQGTRTRLEKGLFSGTPPRGYSTAKKNGEKIVVPNKDARFVKMIFQLKVHENKTNAQIAKIVNDLGFNIYPRSISRILANPFLRWIYI
jgi:site-specific DNA recombinase